MNTLNPNHMKAILPIIIAGLITFAGLTGMAQEVIVTDEASYNLPASGALLDVKSTTKGMIIPRMTTTQRTTLGSQSPATGVIVFDSDKNAFYYWNGSYWNQLAASGLYLSDYKFGNATDYATFEADGTLALYGNATVYDDIMIPGMATRGGASAPSFEVFIGKTYINVFKDNGTGTEDEVHFAVQFPHSWNGDTIYPHIHWSPQSDPGASRVVRWALEYTWAEYNSSTPITFPSTTTIYANAPCESGSDKKHLIGSFGSIVPTTSQDGISSMMVCRLYRNTTDAIDTYTGGAAFLQFDIHFKKNTEGSRQVFTK